MILFSLTALALLLQNVWGERTSPTFSNGGVYHYTCPEEILPHPVSVLVHTVEPLEMYAETFHGFKSEAQAVLVEFWLEFPKYKGVNAILHDTRMEYGLWHWFWASRNYGKSLLRVTPLAEIMSFTTLYLRARSITISFSGHTSAVEIASLPEECKRGLVLQLLKNVTTMSDGGKTDEDFLCHRRVDIDISTHVQYSCCNMEDYEENDNYESCSSYVIDNAWLLSIKFSKIVMMFLLFLFILPLVSWKFIPTEMNIRKHFRTNDGKTVDVHQKNLLLGDSKTPVTIGNFYKYWNFEVGKQSDTDSDRSADSIKARCRGICHKVLLTIYFCVIIPIFIYFMIVVRPLFLWYRQAELDAWQDYNGAVGLEYSPVDTILPFPYVTRWRMILMLVGLVPYIIGAVTFIWCCEHIRVAIVCLRHYPECQLSDTSTRRVNSEDGHSTSSTAADDERFYETYIEEIYGDFLHIISEDGHAFESIICLSKNIHFHLFIQILRGKTWKQPCQLFKSIPLVALGFLVNKMIRKNQSASTFLACSSAVFMSLLSSYILQVALWVIVDVFTYTLMGITLNID